MHEVDLFARPVYGTLLAVLLASLLLATGWWLYRAASLPQGRRRILLALRLAAAATLLAVLFRPAVVFTEVRKRSATFYILVDRSRSMTVADEAQGISRWDAARAALRGASDEIQELATVLDVHVAYFDQRAYLTEEPDETPDGEATALGDVLREVLQEAGRRVAAVLVLSDGKVNAGKIPPVRAAELYRSVNVPIYTVGFGRGGPAAFAQDVGFRSIEAGPTVFARTRLPVQADFVAVGFPQSRVRVELRFGDAIVATETIQVRDSPYQQRLELDALAAQPGELKVTLRAEVLDASAQESVKSNNEISTWVTVLSGGLQVAILDGSPETWEGTFLKRSLDRAQEIQAVLVKARTQAQLNEALRAIDLASFDVVLIRDVPARWFPEDVLERLAQRVEQGMGLGMLGGRRSFGPGRWGRSPLSAVLPVRMHPADRQIERPLKVVPTEEGLVHFIMRLGADDVATQRIWEELPPLRGASSIGEPKPVARLLATGNGQIPLLVSQEYGAGRTVAFGGDTTWQWHLYSDEGRAAHRRFWRQLVLWLARREDVSGTHAWVELSARRIHVRDSLEISAGAEDDQGQFLTDAEYELVVVDPAGEEHITRLYFQGDRMHGVFWDTDKTGDYTVRLTVRRGDQLVAGPIERRFLVYQEDLELADPAADLDLLEQLATVTGGEFVLPEELPELLRRLQERDYRLEIRKRTVIRLWDRWPVLLLFVGLLVTEWTLRKRWGLP